MSKKHKRSAAQIAASRVNGALSKGPVTPEGKAIAARNSLTHGAHAANPVLRGESQEEFDASILSITLELFPDPGQPPTYSESGLVRDIASAKWRRERTVNMMRALADLEMEKVEPALRHLVGNPDLPLHIVSAVDSLLTNENYTLEKLERQEVRLERLESRARTQLLALKTARLKERELALQERKLALEEAALAAATVAAQKVQDAPKTEKTAEPGNAPKSNSGNNLTVLIPAAISPLRKDPVQPETPAATTTPDREGRDKAA